MNRHIYEVLGFPERAFLGRRVYKKHFYDNARMNSADRALVREDIDVITWSYTLKPNTTAIAPYDDGVHEYIEIAVLHVVLNHQDRVSRVAEIVHRAIPYPVIMIFEHLVDDVNGRAENTEWAISVAPKRVSQNVPDALVVQEVLTTSWLRLDTDEAAVRQFFDSVRLENLPAEHFYTLYTAIADRIRSLELAQRSGRFDVARTDEDRLRQRKQVERLEQLETELRRLRTALKREPQFNRKVELNTEIQRLKKVIQSILDATS